MKVYITILGISMMCMLARCQSSQSISSSSNNQQSSSQEDTSTANSDSAVPAENETSLAEQLTQYLQETIEMGQLPDYEGLQIIPEDTVEQLFDEDCIYFRLGTNYDDNFVTEHHVYVSVTGAIYEYDVLEDGYFGKNVPGKIVTDGWGPLTLAAIITDPYSEEAMWYYAGMPEDGSVAVVALQNGVTVRLEKVHIDENTYLAVTDEVIQQETLTRNSSVYWSVPMSETIPEYRIVVEYDNIESSWEACYDGENNNVVQYVNFYYE